MKNESPFAKWRRVGLVLALAVIFSNAGNAETEEVPYELLVEGQSVSIQAVDRPLIQVLRDLGDKMEFEVDADLGEDVRVSVTFRDQPVDDAISTLCEQVGYVIARNPTDQRIRRLVLTSKKGKANRTAERPANDPGWRPSQPPPVDQTEAGSIQQAGAAADDEKPKRDVSESKQTERDD